MTNFVQLISFNGTTNNGSKVTIFVGNIQSCLHLTLLPNLAISPTFKCPPELIFGHYF